MLKLIKSALHGEETIILLFFTLRFIDQSCIRRGSPVYSNEMSSCYTLHLTSQSFSQLLMTVRPHNPITSRSCTAAHVTHIYVNTPQFLLFGYLMGHSNGKHCQRECSTQQSPRVQLLLHTNSVHLSPIQCIGRVGLMFSTRIPLYE